MSAFTEPLAQVRAALSWDFHAAPHDYHGNRLVPAKRMDEFIGLCEEALAALAQVERLATDMEKRLDEANGKLRSLGLAVVDTVLSAREEGADTR